MTASQRPTAHWRIGDVLRSAGDHAGVASSGVAVGGSAFMSAVGRRRVWVSRYRPRLPLGRG